MTPQTERAGRFAALDDDASERWSRFGDGEATTFPRLLGLEVEEIRQDYCRMRLPFRSELLQKAGFVHGGAIASLIDHVMVPAVGSLLAPDAVYFTVDMHVQYLRSIQDGERAEDAVAEGWITRRGRRTVFGEAEAFGARTGDLLAKGVVTYAVSSP